MIDSVLLVRPYSVSKKEFPLALLHVGAALKEKGYKVQIIDLQDDPSREDEIIKLLEKSPEMILGISALTLHYRWVKQFVDKLKKCSPKTIVVLGGHISIISEILLENTRVDFICTGEGEITFPELINSLNKDLSPKDVLGLAFKEQGQIIKTGFQPLLKEFHCPDYDLINMENYIIYPFKDMFFKNSPEYRKRQKPDDKLAVIMFSRGCIGGCNFCYRHLPGFRQESVERSWWHLMLLRKKYGIKYFRVDDELFTNCPEWFNDFYEKFKKEKPDILFRITGLRTDLVTDRQLEMLKEMGCIAINYGIESGSQTILDNMNKRITFSQNLDAIKKTLSHGMQCMAYIMIGYEGEDKKTLDQTLNLLLESGLKPEYISIFYTIALPGTKLYRDCLKNSRIKNESEYLEALAVHVETNQPAEQRYILNFSSLSKNELVAWRKSMPYILKIYPRFSHFPLISGIFKKVVYFIFIIKAYIKV